MSKYKMVPVEPTAQMLLDGQGAWLKDPLQRSSTLYKAMVAAAPAVQGEPAAFDEDVALTLAEREFYTEIDERLAADIIRYARKLHTLYSAPQPAEQQPDVAQLVEALEQIERWDGFPSTGEVWEGSGEPVSYGAAFGSNGERDFMRGVARKALAAYHKQGGKP